jgi:TetR/AcrR family transcriptional regulator, transcriptional repressor for nem operon
MDVYDRRAPRGKIVAATAALTGQRGPAGISFDDGSRAAGATRAQLGEHFSDVGEVLDAARAVRTPVPAPLETEALRGLNSIGALRAWAEMHVDRLQRDGFCDHGLPGALADPETPAAGDSVRALTASLASALHGMRDRGILCPEADPDSLASSLLAMLIGGMLLACVRRDTAPLRSAVTVMIARVESFSAGGGPVRVRACPRTRPPP